MYKKVTLSVDDAAIKFYEKIARSSDRSAQQVMADALFNYAGQLAIQGIHELQTAKNRRPF